MKVTQLSRRTALKGLGATLALPWLEAMGPMTSWARGNPPASQAAPNRMAFLYVPNGVNMDGWRVGAEGALPSKLPPILAPLANVRNDFSVLTGLAADKARKIYEDIVRSMKDPALLEYSGRDLFDDGQIIEHGGELIDTGHKTIRALARRFNLPIDNLPTASPAGSTPTYYFDDAYYPSKQADRDFLAVYPALQQDLRESPGGRARVEAVPA